METNTFKYTSSEPSKVHNIKHDLNNPNPVITVWVDGSVMLDSKISTVDANNLTVKFNSVLNCIVSIVAV